MIQMLGSSRLLNKAIQEDANSTNTNRIIELYGITSIDELTDVPMLVKSSVSGTNSTTYIEITSGGTTIDTVKLNVYNNGAIDVPFSNWVIANQLYFLVYDFDNSCFNAFPIGSGESAAPPPSTLMALSDDILTLTNSSTSADIANAFDGAENEESFINWMSDMSGQIVLFDLDYTVVNYITVNNYRVSSDGLHYSIYFNTYNINSNNTLELVYKVMIFNKTAVADATFSSVSVKEVTISDGNGVAY